MSGNNIYKTFIYWINNWIFMSYDISRVIRLISVYSLSTITAWELIIGLKNILCEVQVSYTS